jgi:predicted hotdog family 3-hydroxylacyl-ACP dehydratase
MLKLEKKLPEVHFLELSAFSFGASEATRLRQGYGAVTDCHGLLWGKRIDNFFEARIATERVPEGQQF